MTNEKTIRNHYVPQMYLMNFSILGMKKIWCFDKSTGKKFIQNVRNIGSEKGFYNQEIENYLGGIESKAGPILKKIIDNKDIRNLNWREREIIADFIAVQDNRTYESRDITIPVNKWILEQIVTSIPAEIRTSPKEDIDNYIHKKAKELAVEGQRDTLRKSIKLFSNALLGLQWVLLENNTDMLLWTSDNPINKINPLNITDIGYLSVGIQISFPITPKLCLSLCDMVYGIVPSEKLIMKNTENIVYQNHLQFNFSNKHIFSQDNNFEEAEKLFNYINRKS